MIVDGNYYYTRSCAACTSRGYYLRAAFISWTSQLGGYYSRAASYRRNMVPTVLNKKRNGSGSADPDASA